MKRQLLHVLRVVILLLMPALTFAQAPPLGTAADFVLFTSVGAVTNVGTYKYMTHLTGNVGTNSGSSTNFGNVNGVMHDGDGASILCAADLLIAYNSLASAIPTDVLGPVIGNGTTLNAGIYDMPGATTLNLDLILDAQGDQNAVFIFKTPIAVAYAFTANPNAKVKLINGAQACNVFWHISGAVDMGAAVSMKGTIVAGGAINMGAQDTLEGRALTINGAITVSNGALGFLAYTPIGCGSPTLTGPAAPTFVGLGSYAIFATTGSVSDCGTSHITGDVGGHTVAPTGFNPLFVSGAIHFNDPSTTAASSDLLLIYNNLLGLPYDIKLMDPAGFGHNLVLTPHTYQMDAAVTFTDTVYLDALGNLDAVFIIKTYGAFASTPGSKVILINGTQPKNVYWFVTGAVSITANSIFVGAIIAHDAIDILDGSVLIGRAFSTSGAIASCGMTASPPFVTATGPVSQIACEGGSATFSVTITSPAPTYQWRRGTVNLIEGGNLSGTNSSTLTINPVALSDAALDYNVVIAGSVTPTITSADVSLTVNPLPVPTIAGPASVAVNSTGNVYSTEAGMTGYTWTVSAGGIITSGSGTTTITVTWNTSGAQTISVTYINANNCAAAAPTVYNVTVNAAGVPTISGPNAVCQGSTGVVYTTEPGMTGYIWTISAGGTIDSGVGSNSISVTWNTAGAQSVGVTYNALTPVAYPVNVYPLPVPVISGPASVAVNSTGNIYSTEAGMTGYTWTVSAGGTITAGTGTNAITVSWTTAGAETVSVNYLNVNNCTAIAPVVYNVTVSSLLVPTITGPSSVCMGATGIVYTTEAGMTGYAWTITAGGTITSGAGSNAITVTWNTTGPQSVGVTYSGSTPASYAVTVNPLPVPTITGPAVVFVNAAGNIYSTEAGMTGYTWTVSAGGTITSGGTTNAITVTWNTTGAQNVTVNYLNLNNCTATAPTIYNVTVNPLLIPTITGPSSVCVGATGIVYTTEAGMTGYAWTITAGGTITSGAGTNAITVTWSTAGAQSVGVTYNTATTATYPVTVNPLPVPTITGPASVCVNSTGNVYTTQTGMTGYSWVVSAGGTIIAGGTSNAITVTWNTTGAKTVSVNYINANNCTATAPAVYNVTVNPLPVPTISGLSIVCNGTTGVIYTTQAGMTGYTWTISSGGIITSGAGTNNIVVTWNTAGAQSVSVNYTNGTGCVAATATVYPVTVNALPIPVITGPASVCINSSGNVYTTEAGMTGYTWNVSGGGNITAGSTSNAITVTWNTTGPKTVSVNYFNANNCTAATPTVYNVTINPLPVPVITGPSAVCQGTASVVYATQTGMTGYIWSISSGGTIIAGGTPTSNNVTVKWNTAGMQAVTVNYTNVNGCTAVTPTSYNVTVNPAPTPFIGSTNIPCTGSSNNVYYTDAGQSNYIWTVSSGIIVTGQGTSSINVTWTGAGAQFVTVNYNNSFGCPAVAATVYNVFLLQPPGAANPITGTASLCAGTNGVAYSTLPVVNATSYSWSVPAGATISTGAGTTNITVNFGTAAVSGIITVAGTNNCGDGTASSFPVTINPIPAAAGMINGPASVCEGASGVAYSVPAITGAATYGWTVPTGATITSGATSNNIVVTFGNITGSGIITVKGINACGNGALSPNFTVMVNAIPVTPVITAVGPVLTSSAPSGNQWYYEGTLIPGATGQSYTVTNNTGYYWCMVTLNDCSSGISNKVWIEVVGVAEANVSASFTIYPLPNDGKFTASINTPSDDIFTIMVYNQLGEKLLELRDVKTVGGKFETQIDLRPIPNGMCLVVFMNSEYKIVRKVLINK